MKKNIGLALAIAAAACAVPASAQITLYERDAFDGRSITVQRQVPDLERAGLREGAASAIVTRDRWEVCEDSRFEGDCRVLRPGRYPSLAAMGMEGEISSIRRVAAEVTVDDQRMAPAPWQVADYRRQKHERLYEAEVTSVRAVVGPTEQRCWVDHQQVDSNHTQGDIVGGVAGALIGGILGHQVGSGRGNDLATAGGAVAGGVIGVNVARNHEGQPVYTRDVQKCRDVPSHAEPAYWDVTYAFRGREHHMQTASRPGNTVTVNDNGEPRA